MTYELLMQTSGDATAKRFVARHVGPNWLKQHGIEFARTQGDDAAVWQSGLQKSPRSQLALQLGAAGRLTIEPAS